MRRIAITAAVLVACALGLVACGGATVNVHVDCPRTCVQTGNIATTTPEQPTPAPQGRH